MDGCYIGLPTKRTSPFMTALKWKCYHEVFPHVHSGKRAFHSELLAEFFDLLAYCFACALDGLARLLVPRRHHLQLLHLRHLPCYIHSSGFQTDQSSTNFFKNYTHGRLTSASDQPASASACASPRGYEAATEPQWLACKCVAHQLSRCGVGNLSRAKLSSSPPFGHILSPLSRRRSGTRI